ncbi:ankyrin repeat domain-containing protein [Legionella gresilensis]|uniref:ankyrin repeat domain-containing protein n=1 Tax=Legionella gresilensis TaxID=91823 RepID=UPI0010419717|nr:ankyrin repeat domain-containing protein [Legionella gresilensis]
MIINLPVNSWDDLLNKLNITKSNRNDKNQQEVLVLWCREFVKSDFQFVSLGATEDLVKRCIELNNYPSLSAIDKETSKTVLQEAATLGYDQFLAEALKIDSEHINLADEHGNTALHFAAAHFHFKTVECLVTYKANPNCINTSNSLPINLAARNPISDQTNSNRDIFLYLLPKTDISLLNLINNKNQRTLILDLVVLDDPDLIMEILTKRPDLKLAEIFSHGKQNILHLAIIQRANRIVKEFITNPTLARQKTANNSTILHLAARYNKEIILTLLEEDTLKEVIPQLINVQDEHGNTALHYLTENKEPSDDTIIDKLIEAGADENISNENGNAAIEHSRRSFSI